MAREFFHKIFQYQILLQIHDESQVISYDLQGFQLHQILQSQADNLWALGVIGLGPHPVIVSNDLHNVPLLGYWGWDSRWTWPYYPETWYLKKVD